MYTFFIFFIYLYVYIYIYIYIFEREQTCRKSSFVFSGISIDRVTRESVCGSGSGDKCSVFRVQGP